MLKFKIIKPFFFEFIIFVLVVGVVISCLIYTDLIKITIHFHLLTVAVLIMVSCSFLFLFYRVVNTGIRALSDYIFQKTKTDNYVFIETQPYAASIFAEERKSNKQRSFGVYYLIQARQNEKTYTFLSPVFVDLTKGKEYAFTTATSSCILIDYSPKDQ